MEKHVPQNGWFSISFVTFTSTLVFFYILTSAIYKLENYGV